MWNVLEAVGAVSTISWIWSFFRDWDQYVNGMGPWPWLLTALCMIVLAGIAYDLYRRWNLRGQPERISSESRGEQWDDSEHDTDCIDAMSRLLNESSLTCLDETIRPKQLGLGLFQAAVDGRIRIWFQRDEGSPYKRLRQKDLRYAEIRKVTPRLVDEARKEIENELCFSISISTGPHAGIWRNPRFSSRDLTRWITWTTAKGICDVLASLIEGGQKLKGRLNETPLPIQAHNEWVEYAKKYLRSNLGKGYEVRFGDFSGIVFYGNASERSMMERSIDGRLRRLHEFLAEVNPPAIMPSISET